MYALSKPEVEEDNENNKRLLTNRKYIGSCKYFIKEITKIKLILPMKLTLLNLRNI